MPEDYESIPGFFSVLEQGERHHRERMDEWLDYVAQAIVNARSIIAGDVIVGGEAAQHLEDSDIEDLKARVIARSPFGTDHFNLRKSYCAEDQNIIATISVVLRNAAENQGLPPEVTTRLQWRYEKPTVASLRHSPRAVLH